MRPLLAAAALALVPLAASADPNPQLLRSLEARLAHYGLHPDMESLSTRQAGALHLTMSDVDREDGYSGTRAKLRAILRWEDEEDQE